MRKKNSLIIENLVDADIYVNKNDNFIIHELSTCLQGSGISFNTIENDTLKISNICYNGGIFISKAYFLNSMAPLVTVGLETATLPMAIILYKKNPSPNVKKFLNIIRELYPRK